MKVFALLSHYDEPTDSLTRLVESLDGFADHIIALDGAYSAFPDAKPYSPTESRVALNNALRKSAMHHYAHAPAEPWESEVGKRAAMFELARWRGATPDDWFLVIDGDCSLAKASPEARGLLAGATEDVAAIHVEHVRPDGHVSGVSGHFRALFRAVDGLTVRGMHHLYAHPYGMGWRYLWHTPHGHPSDVPALDLTEHVTMQHHFLDRSAERDAAARLYYRRRCELQLERAPHY